MVCPFPTGQVFPKGLPGAQLLEGWDPIFTPLLPHSLGSQHEVFPLSLAIPVTKVDKLGAFMPLAGALAFLFSEGWGAFPLFFTQILSRFFALILRSNVLEKRFILSPSSSRLEKN